MPTPSGTISLANVNTELGLAATTTISMNQTNVRTLAGVPSGAISMQNLQNKSNRVTASATIASNTAGYTLNTAKAPGYVAGSTDMTLTINSGVIVYSTSTGSYAFVVDTSWAAGDTITIVNNGTILGRGGNGGTAPNYNYIGGQTGNPGGAAGPGLLVQRAVSINNGSGRISGGGGGGGSTGTSEKASPGGGGGGIGGSSGGGGGDGGAGYNGVAGSGGTLTSPGSGSNGGGSGGSYGATGATAASVLNAGGSGGAGGAAVVGNSNITWIATGTRNGAIT